MAATVSLHGDTSVTVLGIIADTHGLLRPEAITALQEAALIIHAGDVGKPEILHELARLAPVHAVRGNVDRGRWADDLPLTDVVTYRDHLFYLLHDLNTLDLTPAMAGFHAVISGHSHRPHIEQRNGVLYVNPGSAGPRRFNLPITLARITIADNTLQANIVNLMAGT